jgi:hypothetical protein
MRADLFDAHWEKLEQAGAEYEAIGEFFNNLTGRGTGKIGGKAGERGFGGYFMFAPKYVQSQLNSLTKMFTEKNDAIKLEYFKNTASLLAGTATVVMLATLFGGEVEDDPKSSKFGRIVLPNGYILDFSGGLSSYVVLTARVLQKKIKTAKGNIRELGSYGTKTPLELILNFLTSKGSPQVSIFSSLINRELYGGEELNAKNFAASLSPIFSQEAYDKLTNENLEALDKLVLSMAAFFGLSSYNPEDFDKKRTKN